MANEGSAEATIRDIKRKTRRKYSSEEKIRIVIEGLRGERKYCRFVLRGNLHEAEHHK